MSAFRTKHKARKITVQDDDDDSPPTPSLNPPQEPQEPALQATFKTSRNKLFKQSSLRKSININEDNPPDSRKPATINTKDESTQDDEDGGAPLRIRPPLGRTASTKSKKRQSTSSRLSFGPSEIGGDDDGPMVLGGEEIFTPVKKPSLASAAVENNAYKKGISKNLPLNRLPMRSMDNDDERPRYSKEYLSELQSSTPNTPRDLSKSHPNTDDDEGMSLDPSELEGAMIVDTEESRSTREATTSVLTEAEIQEKKMRRARIAKQQGSRYTDDFISISDDERGNGESYLTVLSHKNTKSKSDTRLVAEDEDLGEGYDEFVEDGGLSLGKKAERESRRRQRAQMASLITAAEGGGSDGESDDSEAERRAAYEAAQTRAGMDGLAEEREQQRRRLGAAAGTVQVPPKITPLPDLSVVVAEFKANMRRQEDELARARAKIEELRAERDAVLRREPEVQRLLNEAGERYRALTMPGSATAAPSGGGGRGGDGDGDAEDGVAAAKSLLDQARAGGSAGGTPVGQRGLESLGTTPVRQPSQVGL